MASVADLRPLLWLDVVGLTPRLLAHAPRLRALGERGSHGPLGGVLPAVTTTAQATALTGLDPSGHGIVGNGWFHRDTGEIRFWLQANALIQGDPVYQAARRKASARGLAFTAAKLFGWFNQGAPVDWSVTPKPFYGSDGSKVFAVQGRDPELVPELEKAFGPFPFSGFWGPRAGLAATDWIARTSAHVMRTRRPTFTLVYLPHLDYDLQRFGPDDERVPARVAEVDAAAGLVLDAAEEIGAEVVAFSEYGLLPVTRAALPNRALREAGLLRVRDGPFGETLDTFESEAFAVADHQIAHVHVQNDGRRREVRDLLLALDGVDEVLEGEALRAAGLDHERAGDLVLLAERDAFFAYPYWLDERRAPDFARTVDIHRKPGYDANELFVDPKLFSPTLRVLGRLLQKKLGFRYRMDVIPLDPSLVRGSHGRPPDDPLDGPLLVSSDPEASAHVHRLHDLRDHALRRHWGFL